MVERPEEYEWSSYRARIGVARCDWLDVNPAFDALGYDSRIRRQQYAAFVNDWSEAENEAAFIRAAVGGNQLTGGSRFIAEVEQRAGVRIEFRSQGRPKARK